MRSNPKYNDKRRVKVALGTAEDCPHQRCQAQDYQNKNWLSVCEILSLQLKPKLGRRLDIKGLYELWKSYSFHLVIVWNQKSSAQL